MTTADTEPNIEGRLGGPIGTMSYLLTDEATGARALVDPVHGALEVWRDRLEPGGELDAVYLTHGHFDHIGGLAQIRRAFPEASVWVHPDSRPLLEDGAANGSQWAGLDYEPASATNTYREGDVVELGQTRLSVIDAPGHCPGSVMLLSGRHLIAGDVLFQGSVGRWDLPGADYETLAASIREKVMTLPDETIVHPGHGPATTVGEERRGNFIVQKMLAGEQV